MYGINSFKIGVNAEKTNESMLCDEILTLRELAAGVQQLGEQCTFYRT
jgi:hypothetical protein